MQNTGTQIGRKVRTLQELGVFETAATAQVALRQRMQERSRRGETYTFHHAGVTYCWDVSAAWTRLLETPRQPDRFRPADQGVDIHHVRDRYPDMDVDYALTCDMRLPLVFVPFAGKHQMIDGWHRLTRCLMDEEVLYGAEMEAFTLTQDEADAVLLWTRKGDAAGSESQAPCGS